MPSNWLNVPHFQQELEYSCVAACVRMVLAHYGDNRTEAELRSLLDTLPTGTRAGNVMRLWGPAFEAHLRSSNLVELQTVLTLKQARLACDSPLSIHVTFDLDDSCGELRTYVVVHLKPASEIAGGFPMSAATQDLRRPSHKGRLFKG